MPKMLHMMNLAGFGMRAWDDRSRAPDKPWVYASTELPVFDRNLKNLAEKVEAGAILCPCARRHLRHRAIDISLANVHPFQFHSPLAMAHNGDLARFAELKPALAAHVPASIARHIRSTHRQRVDLRSHPRRAARPDGGARWRGTGRGHRARAGDHPAGRDRLGIDISSSVNLFVADGTQVAAVRYCFDFGRYATGDQGRIHEANLNFLSLWYTLGRDYGLHEGEWKMTGGAEAADAILVASEPLTRDIASWVEVPEYAVVHAQFATAARP